jgi:hypothetical protein
MWIRMTMSREQLRMEMDTDRFEDYLSFQNSRRDLSESWD